MFRPTLERFVRGDPEALLLVEFAEDEAENRLRIAGLKDSSVISALAGTMPEQIWAVSSRCLILHCRRPSRICGPPASIS